MTRKRFRLARYVLAEKEWDYFMMVEIGVDRIQHAFWATWTRPTGTIAPVTVMKMPFWITMADRH